MNDAWDGAEASFRRGQEQSVETTGARNSMLCDGYAVSYGLIVGDQSGLPLAMRDGEPVEPAASAGRSAQLCLKRMMIDLPFAVVALLVLSPLLIGVAVTIRIGGMGSILAPETRRGLDGRAFRMLRFRTYAVDGGVQQLGEWLHSSGIEGLPQLWNVIVGDMSLVGPALVAPEVRDATTYGDYRLHFRPGLTGWADMRGLHATDRQRLDHDCAYVQNFSLFLDAKIIVRTLLR